MTLQVQKHVQIQTFPALPTEEHVSKAFLKIVLLFLQTVQAVCWDFLHFLCPNIPKYKFLRVLVVFLSS